MSAQEIETPVIEIPVGGTPASAPETAAGAAPSPASTPAPAAKPEKETLRETVTRAVATARVRDEHGKFAPAPAAPAPQFPTPEAAAPQRPTMPKSLRKELESHWNTAPVELVSAIVQREADFEKGVTPLKEKARFADIIANEFKPYEMLLKMENTTPERAIGPLLQTAALFRTGTPVQKAQAVASIMRQYSISPEHVQQVLSGQAPPQPAIDPQLSQLTQQVQQLTQFQQSQNEARAMSAIEQFAANPEHKYFDSVAEDMHDMMTNSQQFRVQSANMTDADKLKLAYDKCIYANPEVRTRMQTDQAAAQQAKDQAKLQMEKAKLAALQVKGNPSVVSPPKVDPKDRRATIARAIESFS